MVGILVISHGRLADALISSVQFIVGNLKRIKGVSIWPKDREKEIKDKIQKEIAEVDDGDGVVILTDILGGTPSNLSLSFLKNQKVEVVTGVNMPMLLTLSSYRKGRSLKEIGGLVKTSGRRSIRLMREVLGMEEKGGSYEDGRR
jgi:mannose PTS system EIIA component